MLQQLRSLSLREQAMLAGLAALLLILVVIFGVVTPILRFEERAQQDYARALTVSALARNLEGASDAPVDDRALRSIVTESADRRKVVYTRINSVSGGALQLDLADVPHAAFFSWLDDLDRESGIIVTEAYVTPGETAGTVEARVTLTRPD